MTQHNQLRLRLFALVLATYGASWTTRLPAQSEDVSVSYSVEPSVITMHEPIVVRFDVLNKSTQPIKLQLGVDRKENFALAIQWPDGSTHERPSLPRREGAFGLGNVDLGPGERLRQQLLLNEWADFPGPGAYEIDVRLLTPIEMNSGAKIVSEPYHASFNVLPRDEPRLKAACEKLAQQIESPNLNVRDMNDAASALAYVDDPVVVPYLERALRSGKYVETRVIDGLVRVGNEDAAQVLITVVKESPAWPPNRDTSVGTRAMLAQQALHTIAATTSNERLKQDISRSVPR
jgi:hypothetical protein